MYLAFDVMELHDTGGMCFGYFSRQTGPSGFK